MCVWYSTFLNTGTVKRPVTVEWSDSGMLDWPFNFLEKKLEVLLHITLHNNSHFPRQRCMPLGRFHSELSGSLMLTVFCLFNSLGNARNPPSMKLPHCNKNPIYVFPEKELRGLSPNFHINVSVSDLFS